VENRACGIVIDVNTGEIKVFAEDTLVYSSKYYRMFEGINADGSSAIFISAKRGSLLSSTEVLLMNDAKGQLVNISRSEQTDEFKVKDEYISLGSYLAQDINKDGIVEIPVCNELDEDKVTDEMQQGHQLIKYKYDWYQYNDGLKKIFSSYINEDQSYILKIKDTWDFANVSCYKDYKNDLMFFYTDKGIDSENKKLLFTIKQTAEEPENKEIELNYISENNTYYILEVNSLIRDDLKYLVPSRDDLKAALYFTNIVIQKDNT
jgi:hypothetical protein